MQITITTDVKEVAALAMQLQEQQLRKTYKVFEKKLGQEVKREPQAAPERSA